ncbi:MAG: hypothetical protein KW788_04635 [Candidatus Doudnabacteria bacterium]|nr:hypothetical protein [Candidatus Doudnabacteria bacterium]
MKTLATIIITLVLVLGLGYLLFTKGNVTEEQKLANQPGDFSHVPTDEELRAGLANAGLDPLSAEGTVMHIHQHIDIVINGQNIVIPAEVGFGKTVVSAIHTHDTSGIIHVESPVQKDFKLGQFFTEWGIKFDGNCVSTFCADSSHKLVVGVNGSAISNPQDYVLKAHDEIEIWYGSQSENPTLIPSYTFTNGL